MDGSWLTYPDAGLTVTDAPLPAGYRHLVRDAVIGYGREAFERAGDALLSWRVHRDAGVALLATGRMRPGLAVRVRLGLRGLSADGPCRIVAVVDEPDRRGFAYGTLPGHPECGEEALLVHLRPDGAVVAQVRGFSVPAQSPAPLPSRQDRAGLLVHDVISRRYLAALAEAASAA